MGGLSAPPQADKEGDLEEGKQLIFSPSPFSSPFKGEEKTPIFVTEIVNLYTQVED